MNTLSDNQLKRISKQISNSFKKITTINVGLYLLDYIDKRNWESIKRTDFISYTSKTLRFIFPNLEENRYAVYSVEGTLFGDTSKFVDRSEFLKREYFPFKKGKTTFFLRKDKYKKEYKEYLIDQDKKWDTKEKQKSRKYVFDKILKNVKNPTILTLPSHSGLDVKYILSKNKNAKIICIERDKKVFEKYLKLGLNTINHNTSVRMYCEENDDKIYLFFYDVTGYLSQSSYEDIKLINSKRRPKDLFINLQSMAKLRNDGKFLKEMSKKYKNSKNMTLDILKETLTDYDFVDSYEYKNGPKAKLKMNIYHFVRKD